MAAHGTGVVIYAKDLARMVGFYQRVLGLDAVESEAGHVVLQGRGVEVIVLRIPDHIACDIVIADPPAPREDTPIKPVFFVASLSALRAAVDAAGGRLQPPARQWQFRGTDVLDGFDPEGNVVQFRAPLGG
jgi:catechol 2,3-dioxygenase-like lactoylglutathione lyase family enzyme